MPRHLSRRYAHAISGLGVTEVALGCTILFLGLGTAEPLTNQTSYSNVFYRVLTLVSSIVLIICGAIAVETAKRLETCHLMLTLVFSTIATLFTLGLLGLQVYVTVIWKRDYLLSNYTFAALIIACISSGTSFFLCFTNICLTCKAGGACGDSDDVVYPVNDPTSSKKKSYLAPPVRKQPKHQNGKAKSVTTGTTMTPKQNDTTATGAAKKDDEPLPLHESRPNTAKINAYWNEALMFATDQKKIVYAEDL